MGRICYLDRVTSQLFTVNHVTLLTNYDRADADFECGSLVRKLIITESRV